LPGIAKLPRSPHDNPDPARDTNWWCWQKPIRDSRGRFVAGITFHKSISILSDREIVLAKKSYIYHPTYAAFIRFENIDENPEPKDVRVSIWPKEGLSLPNREYPESLKSEEPAPVLLDDGRIFATMRNETGYAHYTVSAPDGENWSNPEILRLIDGTPAEHPLGPCPLYRLNDGRYLFFFCGRSKYRLNNPEIPEWQVDVNSDIYTGSYRNPLYCSVGVYDGCSSQPIKFGLPFKIVDTEYVAVGHRKRTCGPAAYTALTEWRSQRVFWYPDRKFYILGKYVTDDVLAEHMPDRK
jgi:hypothetical protein